ncbi:hypothetical protein PMAYCL1PPCAC_13788, partial [Pristionchus mayeri]
RVRSLRCLVVSDLLSFPFCIYRTLFIVFWAGAEMTTSRDSFWYLAAAIGSIVGGRDLSIYVNILVSYCLDSNVFDASLVSSLLVRSIGRMLCLVFVAGVE